MPALRASAVKPASAVGPHGGALVGDANAPVTITEYGDFQCPVCGELHQLWEPTLEQLIQHRIQHHRVEALDTVSCLG